MIHVTYIFTMHTDILCFLDDISTVYTFLLFYMHYEISTQTRLHVM